MKPIKAKIHSNGSKLMMIENLLFFKRNTQAKMEQMITATGYNVMARTNEPLARFTPLSKLMNDNPQMTNQGIRESAYRI